MSRSGRAWRYVGFAALGLILAGLGVFAWLRFAPRSVPPGQPALATLSDPASFRAAFNAAGDETRVLVLLSPT